MAALEGLVLDGLDLNDQTNYKLQGADFTPPRKRQEWAQGADADGSSLVRDPLFDNREATARIRVAKQTTMDAALAQLALIVAKLEEAEQQAGGLPLVWTPAGATKTYTLYVLSGEVDGLPITLTGDDAGWFLRAPVVTLRLTCKPFGYGAEVTSSTASSATPFVTLTLAGVPGDVPAEARLLITDAATQNRRYAEFGLEQRFYDPATQLLIDSDAMVISGYNGVTATRTGGYPGGTVIRGTLIASPTAICATAGTLTHVGSFRVKGRVWANAAGEYMRLNWSEGDGPYRANPYVQAPVAGTFCEVDFGLITVPPKQLGTQRWQGRIEAYTTTTPGTDTCDIDYLTLVPAGESYGRARGQLVADAPTVLSARDEYDQTAGALSGKTAPIGGVYVGAGDADDFTVETTGKTAQRTAVSDTTLPRIVVSGVAGFALQAVQADVKWSVGLQAIHGIVARYVDINNYYVLGFSTGLGTAGAQVVARKVIGGAIQPGAPFTATLPRFQPGSFYRLRLTVDAFGVFAAWAAPPGGSLGAPLLTGQDVDLATGGVLASGKPGLYDVHTGGAALTRNWDNFMAWVPAIPTVIYSGRTAEIRHDGAQRADSTGTYYGPVPAYRGSRCLIPCAGDENRTSRILAKAHRTDIEAEPAGNVTDNLTIQAIYTPRYVAIPH